MLTVSQSMKQNGNNASNKHYNPKNKKPDIPLDADEVDSAMERFIRKKYQEKSLVDGRPEPPSRADMSPGLAQSSQSSQPSATPELPPTSKKHKFFGFSLRTSSKKDRPGVQDAFKVTPVEYSPTSGQVRELPDRELQEKLAQLRDMGFPDNERNTDILKRQGGDLERSVAMLVRLGPSEPSRQRSLSPAPSSQQAATTSSAPPSATVSNNPWAQLDRPQAQSQQTSGFGLSFDAPRQQAPQQPPTQPSANPWQSAMSPQQTTGVEQQFSGMQVSNPLFPHHTGGQPSYQDPRLQTMAPAMPTMANQYGYTASPTSNAPNSFYQQSVSSQSTGNNPFLQQQHAQPLFAPQANPFMAMQQAQSQGVAASSSNPFGLPPAQQQPYQGHYQPQTQATNPFGHQPQSQNVPMTQQQSSPYSQQQPQSQLPQQAQNSQPQMPNFNYGQPQQYSQAQQPQFQQSQPQQQQEQAFYQNQQYQSQQSQPQPLQSQPTGRYTKTDIMALFNQPSSYSQQPLQSVQEGYGDSSAQQDQAQHQMQQHPQQQISQAPSNNPYGALGMNAGAAQQGKRAATMPAMNSMHNSGGAGSRNPFMSQQQNTATTSASSNPFGQPAQGSYAEQGQMSSRPGPAPGWNQGIRHTSNESVSVNNPALMDGRHSPDAFASLSSRY